MIVFASESTEGERISDEIRRRPVDSFSGVLLVLDVTGTPSAAETIDLNLEVQDQITGKWKRLTSFGSYEAEALEEDAENGEATILYFLHPAAENPSTGRVEAEPLPLPSIFRVVVETSEGEWTYSLSLQWLV